MNSLRCTVFYLGFLASTVIPNNSFAIGAYTQVQASKDHAATRSAINANINQAQTTISAAMSAMQTQISLLITEQTRVIDFYANKELEVLQSIANAEIREKNEAENLAMRRDEGAIHQAGLDACVHITNSLKDEVVSDYEAQTRQVSQSYLHDLENGRLHPDLTPEQVSANYQDLIIANRTGQDGTPVDSAIKASTIFGENPDLDNLDPMTREKTINNAISVFAGAPEPQVPNPTSVLAGHEVADRATASIRRSVSSDALAYLQALKTSPGNATNGEKIPSKWNQITSVVNKDYSPEGLLALESAKTKELLEGLNRKTALQNTLLVMEIETAQRQLALLAALNFQAVDDRNKPGNKE